jgi:hypothetical protein
MANNRADLKSTLKTKVPIANQQRNLDSITEQIEKIHHKSEPEIIRTTIHLPKEVHTRIKVHCAEHSLSFKDFVTEKLISSLHDVS